RASGSATGQAAAQAARERAFVVDRVRIVDVADFPVEPGLGVGRVRRPLGAFRVGGFVAGAVGGALGGRGRARVLACAVVVSGHGGVLWKRTHEASPRTVKAPRG